MNTTKGRAFLVTFACALLGVAVAAVPAQAAFGITSFSGLASDGGGASFSQAAGHPYQGATTIEFPIHGPIDPDGQVKDIIVDLPPGFIANPQAVPSACTFEQIMDENGGPDCPVSSQIGYSEVFQAGFPFPTIQNLYNMVPPPGYPAMLGMKVNNSVPVLLFPRVRSDGDYGVSIDTLNIQQILALQKITVTVWGTPGDPAHDNLRGLDANGGSECSTVTLGFGGTCSNPAGYTPTAFLTNPSNCAAGPLATTAHADEWENPGIFHAASFTTDTNGNPTAVTGCDQVPFEPTFSAAPTTNQADTPSGLEVEISVPTDGLLDPNGIAQANLKRAVVTLPPGMTVNPSSANGLGACSTAQIGLTSPIWAKPVRFGEPADCPASARLGTVEVDTPLLDHPLQGSVYLAAQNDNPFGSLLALYIAIEDHESGVVVKLAGEVKADPSTGQLTASFDENPQVPFANFRVDFFGGPRASLKTPATCGAFATATEMTPWSTPETANANPPSSFEIQKGAGAGACPASEASAPNSPSFSAGTEDATAGVYSPFLLKLSRADGTQRLKAIDTVLPKGLVGKLAGTPYCPDGALAAAAGHSGRSEQASPSCPAASQVGSVTVGAGAGSTPLYVGAKAYLAGPYKGAPLSLAIITPAVAGPFDLGTVVVRTALNLNPETAQIHAVSDPLPTILQGIPLELRSISLRVDKPNFTLNPTSCNPMAVVGSATSLFDQIAPLSNPFQVGDCAKLGFKPKLAIRLKGGTKRSDYPALTATLKARPGDANIARTVVALPHSEFLAQSHIKTICTRVQFAADQCPLGSVYGSARAFSPLLDQPLEGPVYLRSSSNKLPDLVVALDGQIEVDLVGRIDSVKGGIRTSFESVPDAPVSKFMLQMQGGKKGLLENSRNLCLSTNRATVQMDGQNGRAYDSQPAVIAQGCKKAKKAKKRGAKPKRG